MTKALGLPVCTRALRTMVIIAMSVLAACSAFAPNTLQPDIPFQAYFKQQYKASPDNAALQPLANYLGWIEQFYQGSPLQPQGWTDVVAACVAAAPVAEQAEVEALANDLGRRVAAEWAKSNQLRKIDTRMVTVWGIALQEAVTRTEVLSLLQQVSADVDALLSGSIDAAVVKSERYYEPVYNEFF